MAISLKHTFQSAKADGADTTLVQPSNWNAEHTITAAAGKVLGRDTSGAGAVQELPIAVDTSGNVGIGTSSPGAKLDVNDGFIISTRYGNPSALQQRTAAGTVSAPTAVGTNTLIGAWQASGYDGSAYRTAAQIFAYTEGAVSGTSSPGRLEFYTTASGSVTPAERMRITSAGRVGIGTTAPDSPLHVVGAVDTVFAPNVVNTTLTGTAAATSGNAGSGIAFAGYTTGSTTFNSLAYISGIKENTTDANYAGALVFGTRPNGSGGGNFERMRITSAGGVGIGAGNSEGYRLLVQGSGTTSSTFPLVVRNSSSSNLLYVDDSGRVFSPTTYNVTITSAVRDLQIDSGGILGYVASIRAAKTNITDLEDVSWLNQLQTHTFNFRKRDDEGNYTDEAEAELQYGLIAEEVEQVNPELVFYDETDTGPELRGVSYSKLIVPLLAALQKANAKIDTLEARLAALEAA